MVYQLNKHGNIYAPPTCPTREPSSSNHQLHSKKGNRNCIESNPKRTSSSSSLVPYESDVSTDSDVENKERSELEKLLTKLSSSSSSSPAKGWKITELDSSLAKSSKSCTTKWDVTEVKMPKKVVRNLSDTELNGKKKKQSRGASGSDSELDKISRKINEDGKKRTSIIEKFKTNFGNGNVSNGDDIDTTQIQKDKSKQTKKENEKM